MTRAVTAAAILLLHDKGQLSLDASVSDYIPAFASTRVLRSGSVTETERLKQPLSIRHLLTYTSGLNN